MIELVVPIHPALEDLWRLFENPPAKEAEERSGFRGSELVEIHMLIARSLERPIRLERSEEKRLRRWHGYLGRLHRARQDCPHAEVLRVMWADWTVTPLCAECGHQGRPMATPAIGDTLVIPRDTHDYLALTGLRSLGPGFFF